MTTEPLEELLNRNISRTGADRLVKIASPLLQEVINYGTHVFDQCQRRAAGEADEDLPLVLSYLHVLEMADGIDVLLSQSAVHPAKAVLRSMFEAKLSMQYLAEADSKKRSFAWLVAHTHARLRLYESVSTGTTIGAEMREALMADEAPMRLDALPQDEVSAAIENLTRLLEQPNYREAEEEYQLCRRKRRRDPNWYSLYSGPGDLRALAKHLRQVGYYDFLYRPWSAVTHAQDMTRWITRTGQGAPAFYALRNPSELPRVAHLAISFVLAAFLVMIRKYQPPLNLKEWYLKEVRKPYWALHEMRLNIVES